MRKVVVVFLFLMMVQGLTHAQTPYSFTVDCDNQNANIENGVKVRVVQMRAGFNYTATVIGMNGFDPVLAVLGSSGRGLCTDDSPEAAYYTAWLPSTGEVFANSATAQIYFANNSNSTFADIDLIVGGFNGVVGEFVLILEGMYVSPTNDGIGDIFSVSISGNTINSGVPLSAYMMSVSSGLDPLMYITNINWDDWSFAVEDDSRNPLVCDDGGASCWGETVSLDGWYASRTGERYLAGGVKDAMFSLPLGVYTYEPEITYTYTFIATSYNRRTEGDYMVAFHMANGDPNAVDDEESDESDSASANIGND